MIHLYSEAQALQMLERCDSDIVRICAECGLPPACLKAVLMMELTRMDILDPLADTVVAVNWLGAPLLRSAPDSGNPLQKFDSSTGYGQIFSRVPESTASPVRRSWISSRSSPRTIRTICASCGTGSIGISSSI